MKVADFNCGWVRRELRAIGTILGLGAHVSGSDKATPPPQPPTKRSPITTHVLDTTRGRPAEHIPITLETVDVADGSRWSVSGEDFGWSFYHPFEGNLFL